MIAHLSGTLFYASERFIVLDVGGVGYKIRITLDTLHALREQARGTVSLWIHTVVREDALDLYGFQTEEELEFFELLISVSGIGPKSGLGILNIASVDHLRGAIARGDTAALTKVSGIGAKSAQKIVLELRDKLGRAGDEIAGGALHEEHDTIEGLVALGFSERDAREALKKVPPEIKGPGARIKHALKQLGR